MNEKTKAAFNSSDSLGNQSRWAIAKYLFLIGDWWTAIQFLVFGKSRMIGK